jgi:Pvc16 N-terminal domain
MRTSSRIRYRRKFNKIEIILPDDSQDSTIAENNRGTFGPSIAKNFALKQLVACRIFLAFTNVVGKLARGGVDVIDTTLRLVANELDQALRSSIGGGAPLVALSNLTDSSGAAIPEAIDRLVVFLVNIEREDVQTRTANAVDMGQQRFASRQPPVYLSLLVMFAANFSGSNYSEALKLISSTVAFFQSKPLFNPLNTPDLDRGIKQLSLSIENLGTTDMSNLWGIFGGRYIPSVMYRLRLVEIDAGQLAGQPRRIEEASVASAPAMATPA